MIYLNNQLIKRVLLNDEVVAGESFKGLTFIEYDADGNLIFEFSEGDDQQIRRVETGPDTAKGTVDSSAVVSQSPLEFTLDLT